MASASFFSDVQVAPPIEVFKLVADFKKDPYENKVNLTVGAYRTNEGKPWVLPVVRTVENNMAADDTLNHEYLPISGPDQFRDKTTQLLLGDDSPAIAQTRTGSVETIGGTGAIRLGLEFLKKQIGANTVYISSPTWPNHRGIGNALGYTVKEYRYWKSESRCLDIDGMLEDLQNAPKGAVVLLHMCAHNPTGVDPSEDEWGKIAKVMRDNQLFVFFDCAYQGFSSGDLDRDATAVRYFIREGFEMFAAQSFSKNFGLYNERVGNLVYVVNDSSCLSAMKTQFDLTVRQMWSNPPNHGSRIVSTVLNNNDLCKEWKANVQIMASRILEMRKMLKEKLIALQTPGTWDHIVKQTGMFSYTGLNPRQVEALRENYHIYVMKSGRINMCGLTTFNIDYVANAIKDVVTNVKDDAKL